MAQAVVGCQGSGAGCQTRAHIERRQMWNIRRTTEPLRGFDGAPVVTKGDAWSYLGGPLSELADKYVDSGYRRVMLMSAEVAAFALQYPFQSLQRLRVTTIQESAGAKFLLDMKTAQFSPFTADVCGESDQKV